MKKFGMKRKNKVKGTGKRKLIENKEKTKERKFTKLVTEYLKGKNELEMSLKEQSEIVRKYKSDYTHTHIHRERERERERER